VLRHGFVKGMGKKAQCEVIARKVPILAHRAGSPDFTYSDCSVIYVSSPLPDGEYAVYFDGHAVHLTKQQGLWLTRGTAKKYRESIMIMSSMDSPSGRTDPLLK
jgi:hypothetical protein